MGPVRIYLCALVMVAVSAAGAAWKPHAVVPAREKDAWKTGYWLWAGQPASSANYRPDVLYVQTKGRRWPADLPRADRYIVVRRIEPSDRGPTRRAALALLEDYKALVADASRSVHVDGLQIDYDSPTDRLNDYGGFLEEVRRGLPPAARLSVTALLDWFGPRTQIAAVLRHVDEFVPQFYDLGLERAAAGIAEPIDAGKWAAIFDAYQIPYRIGISSFGRVARRRVDAAGRSDIRYFRDVSPMALATRRQLPRSIRTSHGGESLVHYDVVAPIAEMPALRVGDAVDVTLPTDLSVREAYESARRFGGYCAGVVFFRWPNQGETLTFEPDAVGRIVAAKPAQSGVVLEARVATCLERHCADLYIDLGRAGPVGRVVQIRTSGPLQAFLPDGPLRPALLRDDVMVVDIPGYAGYGTVRLGRAISRDAVRFQVIER